MMCAVLFLCLSMPPAVLYPFKPCWWLRNPHLQTIGATWFKAPFMPGEPQRVELDDGDFIDLIWHGRMRKEQPLVLLLHGLEGGADSHYIRSAVSELDRAGFQVVLMYHRGCSAQHNRLARSYHSGETQDLEAVLSYLQTQHSNGVYAVVGYSLGANALLKYLGERGDAARLEKAIAVSTPFELMEASRKLNRGVSRVYQRYLVSSLIRRYQDKFSSRQSPLKVDVQSLKNFYDFDEQVTAALNGFDGADDYYQRCSSRQFLSGIDRPCLIIHAQDDPFLPAASIPELSELPDCVQLQCSEHGGHVGFIEGPWWPRRWLSRAILQFL